MRHPTAEELRRFIRQYRTLPPVEQEERRLNKDRLNRETYAARRYAKRYARKRTEAVTR